MLYPKGFGRWSPVSNWSNSLVSIEVYLHLFQSSVVMSIPFALSFPLYAPLAPLSGFVLHFSPLCSISFSVPARLRRPFPPSPPHARTALLYAKFCRPTKITRQVVFSKNGCVSTRIRYFKDGAAHVESDSAETQSCGHYVENGDRTPVLLFRFVNIRPVMLVGPSVELLLVRRGGAADTPFATVLHCECNWIHGSATQTHRTQPYLDLPVLVRHTVDETSPLHDCIFDVQEMERRGYEFILLVEYRVASTLTSRRHIRAPLSR